MSPFHCTIASLPTSSVRVPGGHTVEFEGADTGSHAVTPPQHGGCGPAESGDGKNLVSVDRVGRPENVCCEEPRLDDLGEDGPRPGEFDRGRVALDYVEALTDGGVESDAAS